MSERVSERVSERAAPYRTQAAISRARGQLVVSYDALLLTQTLLPQTTARKFPLLSSPRRLPRRRSRHYGMQTVLPAARSGWSDVRHASCGEWKLKLQIALQQADTPMVVVGWCVRCGAVRAYRMADTRCSMPPSCSSVRQHSTVDGEPRGLDARCARRLDLDLDWPAETGWLGMDWMGGWTGWTARHARRRRLRRRWRRRFRRLCRTTGCTLAASVFLTQPAVTVRYSAGCTPSLTPSLTHSLTPAPAFGDPLCASSSSFQLFQLSLSTCHFLLHPLGNRLGTTWERTCTRKSKSNVRQGEGESEMVESVRAG